MDADSLSGRTAQRDTADRDRLCSELASVLDDYEALADDIAEACAAVASDIPAAWRERALSEIATAGYRPNHKHGVAINITPLARAELVPKTVADEVC
jgi:hypothetical protein